MRMTPRQFGLELARLGMSALDIANELDYSFDAVYEVSAGRVLEVTPQGKGKPAKRTVVVYRDEISPIEEMVA